MTLLEQIREAFADYMASEGCSCCEDYDHKAHALRLGALLLIPEYADGSGIDYRKFTSGRES